MPALVEMTNREFGRLRVLRRAETTRRLHEVRWKCLCAPDLGGCGTTITTDGYDLRRGRTRSCGCLAIEMAKARFGQPAGLIPLFATVDAALRWLDAQFAAEAGKSGSLWVMYRALDNSFRTGGFRPDPAQWTRLQAAKELIPELASHVCDWCRTEQPADQMGPVLFAIEDGGSGMQCRDDRACTKRQKGRRR